MHNWRYKTSNTSIIIIILLVLITSFNKFFYAARENQGPFALEGAIGQLLALTLYFRTWLCQVRTYKIACVNSLMFDLLKLKHDFLLLTGKLLQMSQRVHLVDIWWKDNTVNIPSCSNALRWNMDCEHMLRSKSKSKWQSSFPVVQDSKCNDLFLL